MENNEIWSKLKAVPTWAQKEIKGGRLQGMTDINPQWRLMAMTDQFGPCGIGWKYTIDRQWTEKGTGEEVCAFTNVSVYFKHDGVWSEAVPGNGGSALVAKEKAGPYTSDECFKMSLTDALSVALKAIGVGADIYCGSKYYPTKYDKKESVEQADYQQSGPALKEELLSYAFGDETEAAARLKTLSTYNKDGRDQFVTWDRVDKIPADWQARILKKHMESKK